MTSGCREGRVTPTTTALMLLAAQLLLGTSMAQQQTERRTAATQSPVPIDTCDREFLITRRCCNELLQSEPTMLAPLHCTWQNVRLTAWLCISQRMCHQTSGLYVLAAVGNGEPCADGQPGVRCAGDPCETAICRGHPNENVRCASFVCRVRKLERLRKLELELAYTWYDKVAVYHHLESNAVLKTEHSSHGNRVSMAGTCTANA